MKPPSKGRWHGKGEGLNAALPFTVPKAFGLG